MENKYQMGQIVFYYENWDDTVRKATISKICEHENGRPTESVKLSDIATVDYAGNYLCSICGTTHRHPADVYPTAKAAYEAAEKRNRNQVQGYCAMIRTVKELICFPLQHSLCGTEYTDQQAREAYIQRAKELLGIDMT